MAGPPTLLLDATLTMATAAIYAYVGFVTWRRRVGGDARLASDLFATWWFALAATTAGGGARKVLGFLDVKDVALHTTITFATLFSLCVALWGLLYYLVYLFTGSRRVLGPISAFYLLFYAWLVYLVTLVVPTGVEVGAWSVRTVYATQLPGSVVLAIMILLIVPPLVGAAGYARLFFRVEERTQRYRIGLVSATLLAWFGATLLAYALDAGTSPAWQVASRFIGLAAAYLIYAAYRPPAWVRARWGIRPVDEPGPSA